MAKKEMTFADRAKSIKAKYTRADWDAMEKKDMLKELSALRDEQEQVRAAMGVAEYADGVDTQMANGGRVYWDGGPKRPYGLNSLEQHGAALLNSGQIPGSMFATQSNKPQGFDKNRNINILNDYGDALNSYGQIPSGEAYKNMPVTKNEFANGNYALNELNKFGEQAYNGTRSKSNFFNQSSQYKNQYNSPTHDPKFSDLAFNKASDFGIKSGQTMSNPNDAWRLPQTSALPFAVSAGLSAIGDVAGLINQKRNTPIPIQFPRIAQQDISLEPQRQALQRESNTARNIMLRNSRDVSSPANAYANQIAGLSSLQDSLGTQMGQSYMNEANTNKQSRMNVAEKNVNIGIQEQMENAKYQDSYNQTTNGYVNSLSNTIPMAMRDYRQQANQTNMMNLMGKEYGMYENINPNETFSQRLARLMGVKNQYAIKNRYGIENKI